MEATLTITAFPARGAAGRTVAATVACPHGTTTISRTRDTDPGARRATDADVARLALVEHHGTEGCRCTRELRRRYGVSAV